MRLKKLFGPALMLAGLAAAAQAQAPDAESELESLLKTPVEGASRFLENALDAPAAVSVIGRDTAQGLGHDTVAEMLERLPGTYVTSSRNYSALGFRGFNRPGDYNARMLMTIDGYRVNDAVYDQALTSYEFPIVADWVKRLELISGPASSVYGGNALLGVANVVTVDGADEPGLGLRAGAEGAGTFRLTGQYGWSHGDTDLFIGMAHHRLAGETLHLPEFADTLPGGRVAGLDGLHYDSLMAKLRQGPWRATLVVQGRGKDVATADYESIPGAPGTHYDDRYSYGELAYDGPWQEDWRLQARANLSRTRFQGDYVLEADDGSRYINRDDVESRWAGFDTRLHWRGWINHSLLAGVEVRRVLHGLQRNVDVDPFYSYLDRDDQLTQTGLYAQDQIRLSERTALTLGLRADHLEGFELQYSPRVALVHRPGPDEAIKLMIGRAFRAPNLNERFYEDGGFTQVANPALRPERISTVEINWERSIGSATRLAIGAYAYRLDDLIDFIELDDVSQYQNVSRALMRGVDLDLEHHERGGWQWRTSLSLARLSSGSATAFNSPRWLVKGHLLGPLDDAWSLGLQGLAMARREGLRAPVPALLTVDAVLRRQLVPGQTLSLIVRNLADSASYDPAATENELLRVPRERRSLALEWRGQF